ncbi:MAG: tetratricopeptide repeat protein [Sandaracinaceae bacterium]
MIVAIVLVGCGSTPPPEDAPYVLKPAALESFGQQLEAVANDETRMGQLFDFNALGERAVPLGTPNRAMFIQGMVQGISEPGSGFVAQIAGSGAYTFRGVVWRDGLPHARFRFVVTQGGFNFHDLLVISGGGRGPRVADIHVLTSAEYLSQTVGRFAALTAGDGNLVSMILRRGRLSPDGVERLTDFVTATRESPEEAMRTYEALPADLKEQRFVQIMRVQAASGLDTDRYLAVMTDAQTHLAPDDPSLAVTLLDAYYLREDWPNALASIRAVRSEYDDPYVWALESRLLTFSGDPAGALALADRGIEAEPTLIDTHDAALVAALRSADTERALAELAQLEASLGDMTMMVGQPGYEGLEALLAQRAAAPPAQPLAQPD